LAKKKNISADEIDLTSFSFVTSCGKCHPGGGPLEYDRKGNRYDAFASDPKNKITSAGENNFDGDYYKARWAETGVIEADCLLCHSPGYNMDERNKQIALLNFKWTATAGAGIAVITGGVKKGEIPSAKYQLSKFDSEGHLNLPLIKEVPTENCLFCHLETDWKKKGTSYSPRFDVHLRDGMKCVECHPSGSNATDSRISGKEEHNFGKGDDPGSLVRNDLDNTMLTCQECHEKGLKRAPIMKHAAFKDADALEVHMDNIACQTCHIPEKAVKAALVQDSTVFNPLPRVPGLKRIWSFYGPDVKPWNYYGEGSLTKGVEKPLFFYKPQLLWYKEKIFPVNSLYSIWYGLQTDKKKGLNQLFMQDIWGMWSQKDDYPLLMKISDDNGDGFLEINRPDEIEAALVSLKMYLEKEGKLKKRQLVFVKGTEVYLSGNDKILLDANEYEYSPYGSTFKLSHDVAPAGAALGSGGCTDCHKKNSQFFKRSYMVDPFDVKGRTLSVPAYEILNYTEENLENLLEEQ